MVELSKCCLFTEEKLSQILFADERNFLSRNFLQWAGGICLFPPPLLSLIIQPHLYSLVSFFFSPGLSYWCSSDQMQSLTINVLFFWFIDTPTFRLFVRLRKLYGSIAQTKRYMPRVFYLQHLQKILLPYQYYTASLK